jgi:hypothetical protein
LLTVLGIAASLVVAFGIFLLVKAGEFSVTAAADLFTALESHGIQIEVPDLWAARHMADEIRAEQAKTRSYKVAATKPNTLPAR